MGMQVSGTYQAKSSWNAMINDNSLRSLCDVEMLPEGITAFIFLDLRLVTVYSLDEVVNHMMSYIEDITVPLRLLFDFRNTEELNPDTLARLKPLFGQLSNHPQTRSAYLAGQDSQYQELYTMCKIRSSTHLGSVEVFMRETASLQWLTE